MTIWSIVIAILIGALIGWIAGKIMKTKNGFWINALLGIIGGALGSLIAGLIGLKGGMITQLLVGIGGTVLLIAIGRFITGRK